MVVDFVESSIDILSFPISTIVKGYLFTVFEEFSVKGSVFSF